MSAQQPWQGTIWEGHYASFDAVPSDHKGYHCDASIDRFRQSLSQAIAETCRYQEYLLPVVVTMAAASLDRAPVVLDVGGGPGISYPPVRAALPADHPIEFHVVDSPSICALGRETFGADGPVIFHESHPQTVTPDIVHIGSVIQYVDDWRGFIRMLCGTDAKYFLISDAFAGDIPTFITAQNFYGRKLPCRFLNIDELVTAVADEGYRLAFKSEYDRTMLGRRDPLPLDALPEQYRLRYAHHLLFVPAR